MFRQYLWSSRSERARNGPGWIFSSAALFHAGTFLSVESICDVFMMGWVVQS